MAIKTLINNKINWVYIKGFDEKANLYLKENFKFHPLDFKDCRSFSRIAKIDIYNNYLFLVLHFPLFDQVKGVLHLAELNIFIGQGYLVTVQKGKFKALNQYFYRTLNNSSFKKEVFSRDAGYLLYKILEFLYNTSFPIINSLGKEIAQMEDEIYTERTTTALRNLAQLKRNILNFRRLTDPQRLVMHTLVQLKKDFISSELAIYFDDIRDTLDKIWSFLDNYKEVVNGLHETNESLLSYRMNKTIKMLTIISVSLLPLTLLTGIYGMNISLPFSDHSRLVWLLFLIMVFFITGTLLYFRKKDIF